MEKYEVDLFLASAADQKLHAPKGLLRAYLALFGAPLSKAFRVSMVKKMLQGQDLRGKRILDVGCGIGDLAFLFAAQGAEVVGVELDPEKVASAKRIAEQWGFRNLRFIAGDVQQLESFGLGQFDGMTCLAVMEHIKDDTGLMRQVQEMLRPGGWFIVDVPNADRNTVAEREEADGHERPGYTFDGMRDLLQEAGFAVTERRSMDPFGLIYTWWSLSLPSTRFSRWLFTAWAPIFKPLIRLTSAFSKRPGTELAFKAVKP